MASEPDATRLLRRMITRLRVLPEPRMRIVALAEAISALDDVGAVQLLTGLQEHASRSASRDPGPAAVLLEGQALTERLGYRRIERLYKQARIDGAENVCRLFVTHAPSSYESEPSAASDDPQATLGFRKARARRARREQLKGMLADPDTEVIANLLENPALTEEDVLKIASRRPTEAANLERIFRHPRWSTRYRVRKALIYNPYTPVNASISLLPFLNVADLREVARSPGAHDWIRDRAREIVARRKTTARATKR